MFHGKWVPVLLAACAAMLSLTGCPKNYSLLVLSQGPGSVVWEPSGNPHRAGTAISVTAVPTAGAHFDHWSGALSGNTNPATVTLNANTSVTAVFAANSYTLAYAAGDGGTVTGETLQTVLYGDSGTIVTAEAATGRHFVRWSDGSTVNPRTDANVTANVQVSAEFAFDTFTLTYGAGSHGTISGATTQTVDYGTDGAEVAAVPDEHCHFVQWSDGVATPSRTDRNVTVDINVMALFAVDTFTLAYSAGEHGTITGAATQTVDYGTDGTEVLAVPDDNCHFVQWSDGILSPARTDRNVMADLSVTAEFAVDTRTLTYMAGEHGGIAGQTRQTVDYGMAGTQVIAVPETGYHFVQWSDGLLTPARTDAGVVADLSVTASFAVNVYTLTYSAGENGTLTGTTSQSVHHGGDGTSVTAVPNEGCHFVQWSDGVTAATRTDTSVTGDITVSAEFGVGIVLHVDADSAAAAPDGITWTTAYPDIQSAVDAAPINAQVWVAEGTYRSVESTVLNLRAAVLVYGGFAGTEVYRDQRDWNAHKCIIDGEDVRMCVSGADYAALDGFTVTRGRADNGGGMSNTLTAPVIAHCVFAANSAATNGGGLGNFRGSPLIEDCVFQGNRSDGFGGGLYSDGEGGPVLRRCLFIQNAAPNASAGAFGGGILCGSASLAMTDCVVARNSAASGGGMIVFSCNVTLRGCVFAENTALDMGGGFVGVQSAAAVDGCTFARNNARLGGGLYVSQNAWSLNNCVFQDNRATGEGGGLYGEAYDLRLRNCTFTRNAARDGGALYSAYASYLTNCILWEDRANDANPEIGSNYPYSGAVVDHSCVQGGYDGTDNIGDNPLFADADGGNLQLLPGSPCLDAGTETDAPATDLLERPRPEGGGVDMGAYESSATDLVTLTVQASPTHGGETIPSGGMHQYPRGARVLLAATPSGMRFTGWTGDVEDNTPIASVVMDSDKTVTAAFALNVVYVTPDGKGTPDGKSWATAYHDIQSAVDAAPNDSSGEVWVAEGTYRAATDPVLTLRRGVLLHGGFAGNEDFRDQRDWKTHASVIDGENARRCAIGADSALLDGFTITHGYAAWGGGLHAENTSPTVQNCLFTSNRADRGAGICAMYGQASPVIADCSFVGNGASNGGGIYVHEASPRIAHCSFQRNQATSGGGGIYAESGSPLVSDCTFVRNSADEGGGMLARSDELSLARCVFVGNSTANGGGGGLYDLSQRGRLENCLFLRNSAAGPRGHGGAVCSANGYDLVLVNCTFTQNIGYIGGAVAGTPDNGQSFQVPRMSNCILWGDRDQTGLSEIAQTGLSPTFVDHCCIQGGYPAAGNVGEGNIDADPLFVDGEGGSVQLRPGSPCLDTGMAASGLPGMELSAPADDLLGRPRPEGAGVDMGAYEGTASEDNLVTLTIQVSPAEGGYTRPGAGTHTFVRGETAWVTALPLGMRFAGWAGDAAEEDQDLALVMDADKTVTAKFVPNILYVNAAQTGPADGRSWATAFSTIHKANNTAAADPGGEVWVAGGNYAAPMETGLMLSPGVSLYGGFAGTETARDQRDWNAHPTVIVGAGMYWGATIGADDAVLDGFGITRGAPGMFIRNCSPRVANCLFVDNSGAWAGGISNEGGSPTVVNCTFKQNTGSGSSAAGITSYGGSPTVTNCVFAENTGQALSNDSGSITVTGCTFDQNSGGGIRNTAYSSGKVTSVTNCVFRRNADAGIWNTAYTAGGAAVRVANCVFAGNSAVNGGGMVNDGMTVLLTNCTFTQNTATGYGTTPGQGGGFWQHAADSTVINCIFWGNTAGQGPEVFVESGTLTARYSCIPPAPGYVGTFYLDPLFADAANGNLRLLPGSPCIDTGTPDGAPAADIEGTPRPQGARFDIGAYER